MRLARDERGTAAAEFAAGTIYNYFSTFEELAAALIRAEIDSFGDRLDHPSHVRRWVTQAARRVA